MKAKLISTLVCAAVLSLFGIYRTGWADQPDKTRARLMQDKLRASQKLLEGIALADFTKINATAEELLELTKTEEWMVYKTPKYDLHSNEFRRAAENVIGKAKLKNIDGVTLAYFELTMSCVRCHSYVREIRDARLPGGPVVGQHGL